MSQVGEETEPERERRHDESTASASWREYQHQREWVCKYIADCEAIAADPTAGGVLTPSDHFGSEFDILTICDAARAFLATADARMRFGLGEEMATLAELLGQYRRTLAATALTPRLAEVAGNAVGAKGSRQGTPGAGANAEAMRARAESVRDLTDPATRKANGTLRYPSRVGRQIAERLGRKSIDPKTVKEYVALNDETRKSVDFPSNKRE